MLQVEIYTPEKTVFKGKASAVQMPGVNGLFEVLSSHAPLISALEAGDIRIKNSGGKEVFSIKSGFVEVLNDHISILVEGVQ